MQAAAAIAIIAVFLHMDLLFRFSAKITVWRRLSKKGSGQRDASAPLLPLRKDTWPSPWFPVHPDLFPFRRYIVACDRCPDYICGIWPKMYVEDAYNEGWPRLLSGGRII